jgi:phosphopantothenate-cysteine ligase
MNRKRVIVTSGGNRQKIDDFRVLTNVSSGALGAIVAEYMLGYAPDFDIDFVYTRYSQRPEIIGDSYRHKITLHEVESAQDAFNKLSELVPKADAIVHAMAVADFGFRKDETLKLKSDDPQAFVDYIRDHIIVNPKIISYFRQWNTNPNFYIVQFKFEINKTLQELTDIAIKSIERNKSNLCIANDKEEMKRTNSHIGHFIFPDRKIQDFSGKYDIAQGITNLIKKHFGE